MATTRGQAHPGDHTTDRPGDALRAAARRSPRLLVPTNTTNAATTAQYQRDGDTNSPTMIAKLVGAVALLLVPGATVRRLVADVLSHDLLGPSDGSLTRHVVAGTAEFASGNRTFVAVYVGMHGVW